MRFSSYKLTLGTRVVYLVILMGALAVGIIGYAVLEMRRIETEYQAILTKEARSALAINDAALYLSDATTSVYALLRSGRPAGLQGVESQLAALQGRFNEKIDSVRRISPDKVSALEVIDAQSPKLFEAAAKVMRALSASDTDRAMRLLEEELQPEVARMRFQIGLVLAGSNQAFGRAASRLAQATDAAIWTTVVAVSISLALTVSLSVYFVIRRISRPIADLAGVMDRLSRRQYDDPIVGVEGHDELATMARSLQAFKDAMQRADALSLQIAEAAQSRRLYEQLEDLASGIPGSLFQFQADERGNRRYHFLSKKTASLHGMTGEQLATLNIPVQDNLRQPRAVAFLRDLIAASVRTLAPMDFDMVLKVDGQDRWIRTIVAVHRMPDRSAMFIGASYDVTRIKQQAQELELAKRKAEVTAQEKSAFLAMMSHEIRTPLNAILGMAQLSRKTPLEGAQRQRIDQICRSCDHLQRIIDDILNLSKLESGQVVLETHAFSVADLLEEVQQLCRQEASEAGVALAIFQAGDLPGLLRGDPFRIRQILVSYVSNAIRFSRPRSIDIAAVMQADASQSMILRFEVRDDSDGMSEDEMARLFQPPGAGSMAARHLSDTTAWALGLAISARLAGLMGGNVGAHKQEGGGNCFWLNVKVQPAQAAAALAPGRGPVESRF